MDPKARKKLCKFYISSESADMDESISASPWHFNRLDNPFIDTMTVGFASDAQEQLSDQVVTEEILSSEQAAADAPAIGSLETLGALSLGALGALMYEANWENAEVVSEASTLSDTLPDLLPFSDDEASMNEISDQSEVSVNEASESLPYALPIPNMHIQVPSNGFGLPVEPATYLQLIDDTEGRLEIRRQAELELESIHILQDNLDLMWESEQLLEQEHAENIESAGVLPLNFNLMIDAALAGTTNPASNEAREILSNAGYQAVDSWIATSPLTFGAAQYVLNRFANGHQTSAELLAQAINAFAAHASIPRQLIMAIPAHWMLADSGATMHLLLDLLLAFADVETHRVVRGFNGSESHCIRAAQLAFCALVTCRGRQIRKSITSGVVDAFVTPDLNRSIFSVARVVEQGHRAHFGGDSPGLILKAAEDIGVTSNFIPFVRGDNMDGAAGLKYFVPTIPIVRTANMSFDINLQPQAHGIFAADEPEEVD